MAGAKKRSKFYDRLAAQERQFSKAKSPIMLIGDRGHCVGSSIKGHQKFGENWREERHARYTPVLITNEQNTSQTCIFCFRKLLHPIAFKDGRLRQSKGTFLCYNKSCSRKYQPMSRDKLSALAIGLSGACHLLFGAMFPAFNPCHSDEKRRKISQCHFAQKSLVGSPVDEGHNT
ncbi:hypothetical protein [Parasitella parasitica]|uniref:Uncharacterized protein n=1 Tax=Parasitella parasitica TaxID=35722 RepID=A0A0B7N4J3_9FUNG|nr:hypothetical protein [Parasitella parasitica]